MNDYIRVSAKTVEDAVLEASIELGTASENLEYNVIEPGNKGFLGFGAKQAVIEVRRKTPEEGILGNVFDDRKDRKKSPRRNDRKNRDRDDRNRDDRNRDDRNRKNDNRNDSKKESGGDVRTKRKKESKNEGRSRKEKSSEKASSETRSDVKPREKKHSSKEKAPRTPADMDEAQRRAEAFLADVFRSMELDVELKTQVLNDTLAVEISGDDMGLLIGKRGQTLDSIQYLTSLVVNKGTHGYVRVKLDTENYRERRRATLENLAKNIAFKVKKTRRTVYLEPMNPYERRIIHAALQSDPYVSTHSEGEEPLRKVVVTLKKKSFSEDIIEGFDDDFDESFNDPFAEDVKDEAAAAQAVTEDAAEAAQQAFDEAVAETADEVLDEAVDETNEAFDAAAAEGTGEVSDTAEEVKDAVEEAAEDGAAFTEAEA